MQFLGKMVHLRHFFKILDYFCILLPKQKIYFCEHLINSTILCSLHKKYIIKNGSNIVKSLSSVKYWLNLVASKWRNNILRAYFLLFLEIWNQFIDATEIIDDFLVQLSRRLKCTIVIMRCPSSVRPSSLTFDIFDFSSETAKHNSTKLDRKQDLNVLYQVCVFRADQKNKMAALASDWLRHFRLLLWNRWTEFNETWQEAWS